MKKILVFLLITFTVVLHAQDEKSAVIKTNGDTIWCDEALMKFDNSNRIKKVVCKGGTVSEVAGKEVAFVMGSGRTIIFSEDGYEFGTVIIWGTNYYLSSDEANGAAVFQLLDKDRKYIKKLAPNEKIFDQFRQYFGECPEFVKEIDKAEKEFKKMKYLDEIQALARKYKTC